MECTDEKRGMVDHSRGNTTVVELLSLTPRLYKVRKVALDQTKLMLPKSGQSTENPL